MKIKEFFKTIYLGDRWLKSIIIDSVHSTLKLQIDSISRIRDEDGNWNYYTDEDIEDGFIVFTHIEALEMSPPGRIPNDEICDFEVKEIRDSITEIVFYITSYDKNGDHTQVKLKFVAKEMYLEDPKQPNIQIKN